MDGIGIIMHSVAMHLLSQTKKVVPERKQTQLYCFERDKGMAQYNNK